MVKWSPPFRGEDVARPTYRKIRVERDGVIGRIVMNSPEKRNPLGYHRLLEIGMAAKELELDDSIKVIILKGDGPSFCSGYDITPSSDSDDLYNKPGAIPAFPENGYIHPDRDPIWQSYNQEHLRVYFTLWDLQKPVIAQIQGHCLAGGSELAAFCDIRVVAEDAQIGWPVGRHWSPGNVQYMPWMTNMTKAKYYLFTSEPMSGAEAYRVDWASEVVPADELEVATESLALKVARTDTALIMMTKRSVNRQYELMGFRTGLDIGTDQMALAMLRPNRDNTFEVIAQKEGLRAAFAWREEQYAAMERASRRTENPEPSPAGETPEPTLQEQS